MDAVAVADPEAAGYVWPGFEPGREGAVEEGVVDTKLG